ncbi:hypothetical protein BJL95_13695 [Methylomonas sp. LWB]|uniref:hypothetical protein n=1 Tax=Methylomonas sp. LWB TaxID=1905845 RepID=UPI0008D93445|nr:hypothetical protein [Methylomonas sp. LWB]OHX38192.1 hypothetical protein BJL95_13695 [Methylomonas sp. LWB]
MNTSKTIKIAAVIATVLMAANVRAHGDRIEDNSGEAKTAIAEVVYDNPAYSRGIHSYPNPIAEHPMGKARAIYVDKAYGQAIYSYPGNWR